MNCPLPRIDQFRKLSHTRIIDCRGYERDDGLWDIEGHLTDTKTETWPKRGGERDLSAGMPAHDMWLRLTIDLDMYIHEAVAATSAGPYEGCGDITHKFSLLKGRRIERGWTRELKAVIGGVNGCIHQWELLGRVATVAYQSTNRARAARQARKPGQKPRVLNTCHMYAETSPVVLKRWPELYKSS